MSIGRDEVLHVAKLAELAVRDEDLRPAGRRSSTGSWTTWRSSTRCPATGRPSRSCRDRAPSRCARTCPDPVPLARPPAEIAPEFADGFFLVPRHRRDGGSVSAAAVGARRPAQRLAEADAAGLNATLHWSQDAARRRGGAGGRDGRPGPLAGMPIAIKDNIVTIEQPTTCGSRILEGYLSPYNATVVDRLRAAGRADRGQDQPGRVRHGLLHRALGLRPGAASARSRPGAGRLVRRLRRAGGGRRRAGRARLRDRRLGPPAGELLRSRRREADATARVSRYGLVAFGSSLDCISVFGRTVDDAARVLSVIERPRSARRDHAWIARRCRCPRRSARSSRASRSACPGVLPGRSRTPGWRAALRRATEPMPRARRDRSARSRCRTPPYAVPTYYIVAPAEAAANLARYDGVRYGPGGSGPSGDIRALYRATRGEGFGAEVRRRILVGTYVLSAGYYDAYYGKAQQVRALIAEDFQRVFASRHRPAPHADHADPGVQGGREDRGPGRHVPGRHLRLRRSSLAGLPAMSLPVGRSEGLPIGAQLIAPSLRGGADARRGRGARASHRADGGGALMTWETVIGLEVHVQLRTRTKMFCGCRTTFGDPPNTNVCPVCLGLPGALPVPNARGDPAGGARRRSHWAAPCIATSVFARKNYFYPDLPKGYQISQFDRPLATGGRVAFDVARARPRSQVGITRLHVEEDAGKLLHDRFPGKTAVDLNRAGIPLAEIVSEPDLRSPAEARAYLTTLRQILVYAGVSECSMEKGSLRVDANLSIRRPGADAPRHQDRGEEHELASPTSSGRWRPSAPGRSRCWKRGSGCEQVTLLFNAATGQVKPTRSKEESHDYRYFPDPDLPPLVLAAGVDRRAARRAARAARGAARPGSRARSACPPYDARVITSEAGAGRLLRDGRGAGAEPKTAANWVMSDVMTTYNETGGFPGPARAPGGAGRRWCGTRS